MDKFDPETNTPSSSNATLHRLMVASNMHASNTCLNRQSSEGNTFDLIDRIHTFLSNLFKFLFSFYH